MIQLLLIVFFAAIIMMVVSNLLSYVLIKVFGPLTGIDSEKLFDVGMWSVFWGGILTFIIYLFDYKFGYMERLSLPLVLIVVILFVYCLFIINIFKTNRQWEKIHAFNRKTKEERTQKVIDNALQVKQENKRKMLEKTNNKNKKLNLLFKNGSVEDLLKHANLKQAQYDGVIHLIKCQSDRKIIIGKYFSKADFREAVIEYLRNDNDE